MLINFGNNLNLLSQQKWETPPKKTYGMQSWMVNTKDKLTQSGDSCE